MAVEVSPLGEVQQDSVSTCHLGSEMAGRNAALQAAAELAVRCVQTAWCLCICSRCNLYLTGPRPGGPVSGHNPIESSGQGAHLRPHRNRRSRGLDSRNSARQRRCSVSRIALRGCAHTTQKLQHQPVGVCCMAVMSPSDSALLDWCGAACSHDHVSLGIRAVQQQGVEASA